MSEVAGELAVPLRHYDPRIRYCGDFYGQTGRRRPSPRALVRVASVRSRNLRRWHERLCVLCCHPESGRAQQMLEGIGVVGDCLVLCPGGRVLTKGSSETAGAFRPIRPFGTCFCETKPFLKTPP